MFKGLKMLGAAAAAAVLMAAPAQAATVIDFATGLSGIGGQVYLEGSTVIGQNVPIGRLLVTGAPTGNGDYLVFGNAVGDNGMFGDLDFNSNGQISIAGCIPGLVGAATGATSCDSVQTLLSGTITQFENLFNNNNFAAFTGYDSKNATLLAAIGLDPNTPFVLTGSVQTGAPFGQGSENSRPSVSADVANTAVPEPATMMLLGTGLLAAFRARRREA